MVTIELQNGYFVEVDNLNSTLKQRYEGNKKDGSTMVTEKIIGYFSKPVDAIERFLRLNRLDKMEGMTLSLPEYVEALKKADTDAIDFLRNYRGRGC